MNADLRRAALISLAPLAVTLTVLLPQTAMASRVVFVNTEPVTVTAGADNNPVSNTIAVQGYTTTDFVGWQNATDDQKQELLHLLKNTTVNWDVVWTLERPLSGPYDMIVMGDAINHESAFGGICSPQVGISDCTDTDGVSISFMFWGCLDAAKWYDPHRVAFSVLGAAGYSWGFENVTPVGQVMGGYTGFGLEYGETCVTIAGASACTHVACAAGQQNGAAEMIARHGGRVDDGPPQINVLEPDPGTFSGTFDLVIEVIDDFGGLSAQLTVPELDLPPALDEDWPFRWNNITLPPGPYNLEIEAFDADFNSTMIVFPLCIDTCDQNGGDGDGDPGDGDTGDGETGDGDGDTGNDSTSEDSGPGPVEEGGFVPLTGEEGTVGCACATDDNAPARAPLGALTFLGLGLGLLTLRRRR